VLFTLKKKQQKRYSLQQQQQQKKRKCGKKNEKKKYGIHAKKFSLKYQIPTNIYITISDCEHW